MNNTHQDFAKNRSTTGSNEKNEQFGDPIIQISNLSRTFKTYQKNEGIWASISGFWNRKYEERVALAPTTLSIGAGQIIGLVGANGAGKTTLLKLLSGLIFPSSGTAQIMGYTPWERNDEYLKRISILLGQKNQLWWDLSPTDSYALLAEIYDLDKAPALKRVNDLAEILNCAHVLKTQLRKLSLGERMKMEIIGSLLHEPRILFLDEPTIGLDIVAQASIRKFIAEYVRTKKPTVILTSHYMDDIAELADRLLLISKGSIIFDGKLDEFSKNSEKRKTIRFSLLHELENEVALTSALVIPKGQLEFTFKVLDHELPETLAKIAKLSGIHDIRIEEVDFEETIHEFLQKESSVLSTRNSNPT